MIEIEILQKEVDDLEKIATDIEGGVRKLITEAPKSSKQQHSSATNTTSYSYQWKELPKELESLQREMTRLYQQWYSSALPIISKYTFERASEFIGCYDGILKEIQLRAHPSSTENMIMYFVKNFEIQRSILLSIPSAAKIKELIK